MIIIHSLSIRISLSAIIASIYVVMSIFLAPISYSWIQFRVSESLTPLPYLLGPIGVIGLTIGCFLTNWFSPVGVPDVIFGPLLTLFAGVLSWKVNLGRKSLACAYPVVVNAFGVSTYLSIFYGIPYLLAVVSIGLSEFLVVFLIGYPLLSLLERLNLLDNFNFEMQTNSIPLDNSSDIPDQE